MTPSEIAELREFISAEFQKTHDRMEGVEQGQARPEHRMGDVEGELREFRFEQLAFQAHVAWHFVEQSQLLGRIEVGQEQMRNDFRVFGEGLQATNRRLDAFREEVLEEFRALRSAMAEGFR